MKKELSTVTSAKKSSTADLKEKLAEVKKVPATRVVRVKYQSCCGCGCDDVILERTVPYDSHLKNGDYVKKWLDDDRLID